MANGHFQGIQCISYISYIIHTYCAALLEKSACRQARFAEALEVKRTAHELTWLWATGPGTTHILRWWSVLVGPDSLVTVVFPQLWQLRLLSCSFRSVYARLPVIPFCSNQDRENLWLAALLCYKSQNQSYFESFESDFFEFSWWNWGEVSRELTLTV